MFKLHRQIPFRVFYQMLRRSETTNVLFLSDGFQPSSVSAVSVCCYRCNISRGYSKPVNDYWYGERTDEKVELAKEMYKKVLLSLPDKALIVYTDGSTLDSKGRLGPCGSGIVIYQNDKTKVAELSVPVSPRSSVEKAEYAAIENALSHISKNVNLLELEKIQIFCDNQKVIKGCLYEKVNKELREVVGRIRKKREDILSQGVHVAIDWIPSGAGVDGNDHADQLALLAAKKAANLPLESTLITERDVQRSMKRFKSITGSRGRKRDYSENVMLGILMKEKKPLKQTNVVDVSSSPPESGIQCIHYEEWERAINKCPKVGFASYSEDTQEDLGLGRDSHDRDNRKDKKESNKFYKREDD
ncbi:uncharacterized protein [Argopecten irradians]|uniref:uncharacterized protein isoform X2 n=1 Tax=Argopecten irradians TaxID=31199 RepID=UPI003710AB39